MSAVSFPRVLRSTLASFATRSVLPIAAWIVVVTATTPMTTATTATASAATTTEATAPAASKAAERRSSPHVNEFPNPGFEETADGRLAGWTAHGRGFTLDHAVVHQGKTSIRCESSSEKDSTGVVRVLRYEKPDRRPIVLGGWSKADVVGEGGDYCLFLDVIYEDGSPWWGLVCPWQRGSRDWQFAAEAFYPAKPVREIRAYVFLRHTTGKVWFDDVFLYRGGLHPVGVQWGSDYPHTLHGRRLRMQLTREAEWTCEFVDAADRVLDSRKGRGTKIVWDWAEPTATPAARLKLAAQAADGERLDFECAMPSLPPRPANPVRENYAAWWETSMRKVYPTEMPRADSPREASIDLARNESEGVQLCVTPADGVNLRDVRIEWGKFVNEQGEAFPAEGIQGSTVGYIFIEHPSVHPAAPSQPNWCPEVLLPAGPVNVPGGRTQTFWLNFHASESVRPGTYAGRVVVRPNGSPTMELPVRVRVRKFALPRTPAMKTAFALMDGYTKATYGKITPELRRQCWDLMLAHRLNPDDISRTEPPALEDLRYAQQRGLNAFNIVNLVPKPKGDPLWTCFVSVDAYPADFNEQLAARVDAYVAELRKAGLSRKAYFYGFDEREPEYDALIRRICKFLKERYPEIATFTTAGYMYEKRRTASDDDQDYMDWYCPLTPSYDPQLSARLRRLGKQVWWYVCCGPGYPYANFAMVDYPSVEGRLLGWMTYGFQSDGLLFWHVNYWQPNRIIEGNDPYLAWQPLRVAGATGDGCLIYPTKSGPVGSIRLANVRDGVEDYDYLALLADAYGPDAAMPYFRRLVKSMTDYDRDPAALRTVRAEIADRLDAAVKKPGAAK